MLSVPERRQLARHVLRGLRPVIPAENTMHSMFVELFLAEDADEPAGERDKRRAASRARGARVLVRRAAR